MENKKGTLESLVQCAQEGTPIKLKDLCNDYNIKMYRKYWTIYGGFNKDRMGIYFTIEIEDKWYNVFFVSPKYVATCLEDSKIEFDPNENIDVYVTLISSNTYVNEDKIVFINKYYSKSYFVYDHTLKVDNKLF